MNQLSHALKPFWLAAQKTAFNHSSDCSYFPNDENELNNRLVECQGRFKSMSTQFRNVLVTAAKIPIENPLEIGQN